VLGCPAVIAAVNDPAIRPPRLAQVLAWAEAGKIVPLVARTYPLAEFADALRAKWGNDSVGGIVLRP